MATNLTTDDVLRPSQRTAITTLEDTDGFPVEDVSASTLKWLTKTSAKETLGINANASDIATLESDLGDAIDTLNGADTEEGSVAKTVKDNAQEATFTPTVASGIESETIEEAVNEVGVSKAKISTVPDTTQDYTADFSSTVDSWTYGGLGATVSVSDGILTYAKSSTSTYLRRAIAIVKDKWIFMKFRVTGTPVSNFLKITFPPNEPKYIIDFTIGEWQTIVLPTVYATSIYIWAGQTYGETSEYSIEIADFTYGDGQVADKTMLINALDKTNNAILNPTIQPLIIPDIYGVVGRELNVYFDNLIPINADLFDWNMTFYSSAIGSLQQDRWTYIPTSAFTKKITFLALDKTYGNVVASATTNLTVVSATAGTGTPKVLAVGDSTTAGGQVVGELSVLMGADTAMSVELIGTQGSSVKHEGISGAKTDYFIGTSSPFYQGGVIDFSAYITNNSLVGCDIVAINLGINDCFSSMTEENAKIIAIQSIANIQILIDTMKTYNSSIKIGIAIPTPPSYSQDSFAYSYNSDYNRSVYKRILHAFSKELFEGFKDKTAQLIWVLPYNTCLDTVNNMSLTSSIPANSRSLINVTRQNNGVHPGDAGYLQIADVLYAWIKAIS